MEEKKSRELCNEMLTTDVEMEKLIRGNFEMEDYERVREHRIGGGRVGGKACGVLLARRLVMKNLPEYTQYLSGECPVFIGSEVFVQYLEENDCIKLRKKHMEEKELFKDAEELRNRIRQGSFPAAIHKEIEKLAEYLGESPVIVRSSSFLEDGFGNAFSGKYESAFCLNQGEKEERTKALENAIRTVYASTMNPSAIEYRRTRNLLGVDEQMALLIQKVAGQSYDDFYMPLAAGMGCSYNPYKWMENMNPYAGMLRMVMGLGTRAVERTPGDYPRLVGLDRAQANLCTTVAERHKFSQRQVDVLDYRQNVLVTKKLDEVTEKLTKWQKKLVLSHDTEAEAMLKECGVFKKVYFADCQGLINKEQFIGMMKDILEMLEKEYGCPVDIEFAVTSPREDELNVNLLQCRPLKASISENVHIPKGIDEEVLFDVRRTSMRRSKIERMDLIVWVDPQKYYEYPYAKKTDVAKIIDDINQHFKHSEKKMLLLVPGRIGTSSPELGVPVIYANISQFSAICEVAYSKAGYHPELSYGSHMFQDLVEADVYYGAINDNSKTRLYQPEKLRQYPNIFPELWPEETELSEIVKVYDVSDQIAELLLDSKDGRAVMRIHDPKNVKGICENP